MEGSILTVNVIQAWDLKALDYGGKSDPYVVIECAGQEAVTKVKWSTLNPIWEEEFMFEIQNPSDLIKILIFDKDFKGEIDYKGGDDFLGWCFIGLEMLWDQNLYEWWVNLESSRPEEWGQGAI